MPAVKTFGALIWAVFLTVLVPHCSALQYGRSDDVSVSHAQDINAAEANSRMPNPDHEQGEAHDEIKPPDGSEFTSFSVNPAGDEEIAAFITKDVNKTTLEHLFIVIHGKLRNGDHYWKMMDNVIHQCRKDDFHGSDRDLAVLVPQFFSKKYNSDQYTEDQLAWGDLNAWQSGARATHPTNTTLTSFDVFDGLIAQHADRDKYPNLKNITVVGHGGGGQLAQRYAAVGRDTPSNIHVRYVHGDPSSCMYFTKDRPILEGTDVSKSSCPSYNTWRYGFEEFPGTGAGLKSPEEYFKQYTTRDVISLVGYEDTKGGGDSSCMGSLQGGENRRARNLIWYRYINTLARTGKDLHEFPGAFDNVTDWSHLVNGEINLQLVVVKDAAHNMEELFKADSGREVLFHGSELDNGWRPQRAM